MFANIIILPYKRQGFISQSFFLYLTLLNDMCLCLTNFFEIYHCYVLNVCASQCICQSPKPQCAGILGIGPLGRN